MCCGFEAAIDHLFWVCLLIVGFLFNLELVVDFGHQGSAFLVHSCRPFSITVVCTLFLACCDSILEFICGFFFLGWVYTLGFSSGSR